YFYRMALAFNRRNTNAWFGLISAYQADGQPRAADSLQGVMLRLFGDSIASVNRIVAPFGAALDYALNQEGVYRLQYQARAKAEADLLYDGFLLAKALTLICNCQGLSLYARTAPGKGVLMYVKSAPFPASFAQFKQNATLTWLR
ncbi:MAG: hypothetical protein PHC61_18005, partial [Chitinivibrionales bacterium]|nr:hypothetical protein [Chitinivibrionales bacterium]